MLQPLKLIGSLSCRQGRVRSFLWGRRAVISVSPLEAQGSAFIQGAAPTPEGVFPISKPRAYPSQLFSKIRARQSREEAVAELEGICYTIVHRWAAARIYPNNRPAAEE